MDQIIADESGTLLSGYFYRFGLPIDDDFADADCEETWIVAKRSPTDDELTRRGAGSWMSAEGVGVTDDEAVIRRDCPIDPAHITGQAYKAFEAELSGGPRIGDILLHNSGEVVLSPSFTERLESSGLTGFDFMPLTITLNFTSGQDPKLSVLRFLGRGGQRPRKVVGVPNACPFCGAGPLICTACGYEVIRCPKCGNITRILTQAHKGPGDKRLRMAAEPKAGEVLDGSRWDGSDFFGSSYITRRAVDWLLSIHAAPFVARPVRVWVDKMTNEQKGWLERAKRPVGE